MSKPKLAADRVMLALELREKILRCLDEGRMSSEVLSVIDVYRDAKAEELALAEEAAAELIEKRARKAWPKGAAFPTKTQICDMSESEFKDYKATVLAELEAKIAAESDEERELYEDLARRSRERHGLS